MKNKEENFLENEFEEKFMDLFREGKIKVDEISNKYYRELGQIYPPGVNRINWSEVEVKLVEKIDDENISKQVYDFLDMVISSNPNLIFEDVVLLGDALDIAYLMNYNTLKRVILHFFEIPQQTYIYFPQSKRCINYSGFDNELFFS